MRALLHYEVPLLALRLTSCYSLFASLNLPSFGFAGADFRLGMLRRLVELVGLRGTLATALLELGV